MNPLFETVVIVGLSVPGFVRAVRALPWVAEQIMLGKRPWACDVCMCFWPTAALVAFAGMSFGPEHFVAAGPAYTIALFLLERMSQPTALPPPME